jgi:hypothetical protein
MSQLTGHPRNCHHCSPRVVTTQNHKNRMKKNPWQMRRVVMIFMSIYRFSDGGFSMESVTGFSFR